MSTASPFTIVVTNVNQALSTALQLIEVVGVPDVSRNGTVVVVPTPVTTTYTRPWERVLFSPRRDANPFFHLMESIWMLAGRNDLDWPVWFNSRFREYSDDGKTVHGAYGHRWRKWFGHDQLNKIVLELKRNPLTRRAVLGMWDPSQDLDVALNGGKDVPCNTHIYFDCRGGKLNMTVCCRSNDIMWGAYGANAVHFSFLQEFIAIAVGVPIGLYHQFSNNWHVYPDVYKPDWFADLALDARDCDVYQYGQMIHHPIMTIEPQNWLLEAEFFCENPTASPHNFNDPFFKNVAQPMYHAYRERKEKAGTGIEYARQIKAEDWRINCQQWIARKEISKAKSAKGE